MRFYASLPPLPPARQTIKKFNVLLLLYYVYYYTVRERERDAPWEVPCITIIWQLDIFVRPP